MQVAAAGAGQHHAPTAPDQPRHVGLPEKLATPLDQPVLQRGHEVLRHEMGIAGKIDRAGDREANARLARLRGGRIEDLGRHAQLHGVLGQPGLFVQGLLAAAEHERTPADQAERVFPLIGELLVAGAAGQVQIAQQRCSAHTRWGVAARQKR